MRIFIRRVTDRNWTKEDGVIDSRAFRCGKLDWQSQHPGISLTLMDTRLSADRCLKYWESKADRSHSDGPRFPALAVVTDEDLADKFVQLGVALCPDASDADFGDLHFQTVTCPTDEQAKRLAFLATKNKVVQPYVHPVRGEKPVSSVGRWSSG